MFQISEEKDGRNKKFKVELHGNEKAEIWAQGCVLNKFYSQGKKVLYGYQDHLKTSDYRGEFLFPFPNRLQNGRYSYDGNMYQFPINDHVFGHAIHGFHDQLVFECTEMSCQENKAILRFTYKSDTYNLYFPFKYAIEIEWLIAENSFSCMWKISNNGPKSFPFGWGWHPYYALEHPIDEVQIVAKKMQHIEVDRTFMPTGVSKANDQLGRRISIGNKRFDHLFFAENGIGDIRLYDFERVIELSYGHDLKFLQLFTPSHIQAIAVEPVSSGIDALNRNEMKPIHLPTGASWQSRFEIKIKNQKK